MQNWFAIIFVFSIFANTYTIESWGLGYGELVLILSFPFFYMCKSKTSNMIQRGIKETYYVYIGYCFFVTILNAILFSEIDISESVKSMVRNLFYVLLYTQLSKKWFNYYTFKKVFAYFSVALAGLCIVQFIAFQLAGIYISGWIPGLSIDSAMREEHSLTAASYMGYIRPHGFLGEPANCAHVLILAILLEIIPYWGEQINIKRVILYIVAMLLTVSTNAYVFLFVAFLLWLYNGKYAAIKHKKLIYICTTVATIAVVILLFDKLSFAADIIAKIGSVNEGTSNSAGLRLLRGPAFFANMPILSQLIGYGWGNFLGFRDHFNIWTVYETDVEYMSAMFTYLTSVGIIGTAIVLSCFKRMLQNKPFKNKAIAIMFMVICLSSSVAHCPTGALFIAFALWGSNDQINSFS